MNRELRGSDANKALRQGYRLMRCSAISNGRGIEFEMKDGLLCIVRNYGTFEMFDPYHSNSLPENDNDATFYVVI